ncbi:MAG: hypothetical protein K6T34_05605 [Thermoflavifilum sp.]|nr:hypothetical protein [Thermoflavifilum sp.]
MIRWIKFLFIVLIGFVVFIFLFSLFLPSVGHTERAGVIQAPVDTVMSRLTNVYQLARWMQGWATDSADAGLQIQFTPTQPDGQACYSWSYLGRPGSGGKFCITHIVAHHQVDYQMRMKGLPPITGHFVVAPALDGEHTWIKWTMDLQLGWWPWWKYYGVMLDRLVGPGMEHALGSLKANCEQADTMGYQIQRIPVPFHAILAWADTISLKQESRYMALHRGYAVLQQYLHQHQLQQQQAVIAQFIEGSDSTLAVHVGLPLQAPTEVKEDKHIHLLIMPEGGFVLVARYNGPALNIVGAYHALESYIHRQHLQSPAGPWEQYFQDKLPNNDSSQVQANVYWPVF